MKKKYKRLSIDFPADEYIFLKMACAKQQISLKDFVYKAVMRSIQELGELNASPTQEEVKEYIENEIMVGI